MNTQIINKIKSDELLSKVAAEFEADVFLVGGSVRDFILGKDSFDRDLIVLGMSAEAFAHKLVEMFDATFVPLDEVNNIYRVVLPDKINYFDVTNPLENSLEIDLKRRDLTVNAVAVNIKNAEIVDLFGGVDDIKNGVLREITEKNFIDDPLRLLRVYRFQAVLGFKVADSLKNIVKTHCALIKKPAVERVNYELLKLFGGKFAKDAILAMDDVGILELLFPFVDELKQVPPNTHHHLNLFNHSLETLNQVQIFYDGTSSVVKNHLDSVDFGQVSRLAHLKLAALMHDIGKFSTWTIEEDTGRHRFIKHDDVGAKMAVPFLKNMKLSTKQIDYVSTMIKNHIYPSHVVSAPDVSEKIMMRFVRKMDLNSIDVIILAMADRLSARGPAITDEIVNENIKGLNNLLEFYLGVKDNLKPLPKLLSGNEIMEILNIKPSPVLGQIVDALHEAQISGDVLSRAQAELFVVNFAKTRLF